MKALSSRDGITVAAKKRGAMSVLVIASDDSDKSFTSTAVAKYNGGGVVPSGWSVKGVDGETHPLQNVLQDLAMAVEEAEKHARARRPRAARDQRVLRGRRGRKRIATQKRSPRG